ncbi:hypothetical protein CSKR_108046 [Clonorchis sinensis]|uniref:Uncharacterized protein n=1 Tax=Clonorchis sinensis TaxID=79923 RepID=A0A419PMR7_CLOSI|nr:hypothetical protein CSKR_108046 [Clonorchis sinensis]
MVEVSNPRLGFGISGPIADESKGQHTVVALSQWSASETSGVSQDPVSAIMDGCSRQTDCLISQNLLKRRRQLVDKHFGTAVSDDEGPSVV